MKKSTINTHYELIISNVSIQQAQSIRNMVANFLMVNLHLCLSNGTGLESKYFIYYDEKKRLRKDILRECKLVAEVVRALI